MALFQKVGGRGVRWWLGEGFTLCQKAHKKALIFLEKVPNLHKIPKVSQGFDEILQYKKRFRKVTEEELNDHCVRVLPALVENLTKMTDPSLIDLGIDAVVAWAHFVETLHREIPRTKMTTSALLTPLQIILEGN